MGVPQAVPDKSTQPVRRTDSLLESIPEPEVLNMPKTEEEDPVTEPLCQARREVLIERIEGLKKAVYISAASVTTIILIAEFILTYMLR